MVTQPTMFDMQPVTVPGAAPTKRWGGRASTKARALVRSMLPAPCTRCGAVVTDAMDWHADHIQERAYGGTEGSNLGPAHAGCNTSAGGRLGAAITNGRKVTTDVVREHTAKWW